MKRLALFPFSILCLVLTSPAFAQAPQVVERLEQSPRHHEWIDVETGDGRQVRCWVVYPEVSEKATAVVLIHENRGLNDWARSVADQMAEAGYIAIAPDLLSGTGPDGGGTESFGGDDKARDGIYKLSAAQVQSDLDAVVAYAEQMPAANGKVVVGGFCWGGSQTFAYAAHNPQIEAALVFYGGAPDADAMQKIAVPVYGFYGGNDFRISGEVPEVVKNMKEAGKKYEPVIYDGAGHGFMRSGEGPNASEADSKAREQAWTSLREILGTL